MTNVELKDFASHLKNKRLKRLALEEIRTLKSLDVQLLAKLDHMPESKLVELTMAGLEALLTAWEEGRGKAYVEERIRLWLSDNVDLVKRDDVDVSDIVLINAGQKQAVLSFLDDYTTDPIIRERITEALKEHYTHARRAGTEAYFTVIRSRGA